MEAWAREGVTVVTDDRVLLFYPWHVVAEVQQITPVDEVPF